jgi:transcriptional regulator with XRE-family HTH domain
MAADAPRIRPVKGRIITTKNPLKETRERLNLTIDQVAYRASLSKQFIIKAEQGVYSDPSETLMAYYGSLTDLDVIVIQQQYYAFQRETRKANYGRLIEPWTFTLTSENDHPFISWRELSGVGSAAGICKLFCVHPAVLNKFEKRSYLLAGCPEQLTAALLESGYKPETLDALESAYVQYKILNGRIEVVVDEFE